MKFIEDHKLLIIIIISVIIVTIIGYLFDKHYIAKDGEKEIKKNKK